MPLTYGLEYNPNDIFMHFMYEFSDFVIMCYTVLSYNFLHEDKLFFRLFEKGQKEGEFLFFILIFKTILYEFFFSEIFLKFKEKQDDVILGH